MKVRSPHRSTPYLNRGDQYRMLGYCVLLVMLMFAMQSAAQPETWNWMFGGGAGAAPREPSIAELDLTPLDVEDPPLRDDAFEVPGSSSSDNDEPSSVALGDGGGISSETAPVADDSDANDPAEIDVSLSTELIETIEDGKLNILSTEGDAYWQALANVDQLPAEAFHAASVGAVRFPVLMSDTRPHLGEVITVRGQLKMLQAWPVQENDVGIDTLYEGWMLTADSANNPWRLLFTKLPEGVEPGEDQDVTIDVTGYFFKRYGYQAVESYHLAPMLIVADLTIPPPPSNTHEQEMARDMTRLALWFLGILGGGTCLVVCYFRMSDRRYDSSRAAMLAAQRDAVPPSELEALKSAKVMNPDRPFDDAS